MLSLGSLNKSQMLRLLEIQEACIRSSSDWLNVSKIVARLKDVVPFDAALVSFNVDKEVDKKVDKKDRSCISANFGYDKSWLDLYTRSNAIELDPCFYYARKVQHAFDYEEADAHFPNNGEWFRQRVQDHGYRSSLCCGCNLEADVEMSILINLASSHNTVFEQPHLAILEAVTPHIHQMLSHPGDIRNTALGVPMLTKAEKEVLNWCKEGKSAWEIGTITVRSERTVKFHLSNIYTKLGVTTRAQAIAKCCKLGLIKL